MKKPPGPKPDTLLPSLASGFVTVAVRVAEAGDVFHAAEVNLVAETLWQGLPNARTPSFAGSARVVWGGEGGGGRCGYRVGGGRLVFELFLLKEKGSLCV